MTLETRSPTLNDYKQAVELYNKTDQSYNSPFQQRTVIDDAVVLKDGKVIAYGAVQLFAEAVLVMDQDAPRLDKARALKDLMHLAFLATNKQHIQQLHIYTKDDKFSNLLIEQFGFEKIVSNPLVKDLP